MIGFRVDTYRPTPGSGMERADNWPPRWVRSASPRGWQDCDRCARQYKMWMTDTELWLLLPGRWRWRFLCTRCFRQMVPPARAGSGVGRWALPSKRAR